MRASINKYLSLVQFAHTIFAMPFALIGFSLGYRDRSFQTYKPWWFLLLMVILCMVFARSAAMAFNRYLDAEFDAANKRTAIREIPSGAVSRRQALVFVLLNCLAFLITTYFINALCLVLAPVALAVILFYSYTKRFTALCHLILGLGLSLAPIGAYIAVTGKFALAPVLISVSVLCWVGGFDIIYALQDEEFDKANKLHSMPAWLGARKALRMSEALHVFSFVSLIIAGMAAQLSWLYWLGIAIFGFFLIRQHRLVSSANLVNVNRAFFTSNGFASVCFAVLVIIDIFRLHT